jgi:Holliday junction DNA helicase RuvB
MSDDPNRVLSPEKRPEDQTDHALRPRRLDDLIGQDRVKENLAILIAAAKRRSEALDHVLFYGPPGLGKCITADSLVLTGNGLVEFSTIIPAGMAADQYTPCDQQVYGVNGLEPASHVYRAGRVPTLRLTTRSGFTLEGTPHHPVMVATPDGPQWKQLADLAHNDFVAIARDTQIWGPSEPVRFEPTYLSGPARRQAADERVRLAYGTLLDQFGRTPTARELDTAYGAGQKRNPTPRLAAQRLGFPLADGRLLPGSSAAVVSQAAPDAHETRWHAPKYLNTDLAYFIGLVVGDGHFEQKAGAPAFDITASESEIQAEVIRIASAELGVEAKVMNYAGRAPRLRFSQNIGRFLISLGVQPVLAAEKCIPARILAGPAEVARAFLQGLFDADGHAWRIGYVDFSSKSQRLARETQVLLANFGIIAHRTVKKVKGETYWQLFVGGQDAVRFAERIGFRLARKQARLAAERRLVPGVSRSDQVPFAHIAIRQLFDATRPHSHQLHKVFDHVRAGDRLLSRQQVEKLLSRLPADQSWPADAVGRLQALLDPHIYWDRVADLTPSVADVYDFCVRETHSFVANGFYNHNTTLAHVIANEMGVNIKVTAGPVIERAGDLAAILTNLRAGDILFIDEVHRLGKTVEEVLYPAMEDYALDIVIGKGPSARNIRLKLPRFTVIGATTRLALLTAPLRARFGAVYRLDFYDLPAMNAIVSRAAGMLAVTADAEGIQEIARRARGTPRVALRLLKRVRDFAQVRAAGHITVEVARAGLNLMEVDELGLDNLDRQVLRAIIEKYNGGPVGLETIAASISEESDTIMDVVEPYLLQRGFLDRTPRGRVVTKNAYDHLGLPYHGPEQGRLL